ncbi:MAG TPA: YihY/virulence factor BrkB family protein [Gemmatimonadaceae bacterium]|jgi:membrane protein|nr:YihY/virulence factor BrkB family protein [Gemmatimonadaceae bacterium]
MPPRPLLHRIGWTIRDYARRVWDNAGEDNIFFLAGGIAFNILLAAVPFVLLLLSGIGYFLDRPAAESSAEVWLFIERWLPPRAEGQESGIHKLLTDIINTRGPVGLISSIGFVWFSTRLFGSLRTVLSEVFDIEHDRGIIGGKLFDIKLTVFATLLFVAYTALSAYLRLATSRGVRVLSEVGVRTELMGRLEYYAGALVAFAVIILIFFSVYKFVPNRRVRWQAALLGAAFAGVLFEIAKYLFTGYLARFDPGSLYTGTLYGLVIVVFWVYYSALIFILGGEVGQVYELRRVRRIQREAFED